MMKVDDLIPEFVYFLLCVAISPKKHTHAYFFSSKKAYNFSLPYQINPFLQNHLNKEEREGGIHHCDVTEMGQTVCRRCHQGLKSKGEFFEDNQI